jgi:hypothetical protein
MNISNYFIEVKNLVDVFASIGAHVDDENLMVMTLNAFGKDYSQFQTLITVQETLHDFQELITLFIRKEMRIVSSNGGSQESFIYSNTNRGRGKVVNFHFKVNTEVRMVDIINVKVSLMEVHEETLKEEEVMEVVVEIIKVNNQITLQTTITARNLGT